MYNLDKFIPFKRFYIYQNAMNPNIYIVMLLLIYTSTRGRANLFRETHFDIKHAASPNPVYKQQEISLP